MIHKFPNVSFFVFNVLNIKKWFSIVNKFCKSFSSMTLFIVKRKYDHVYYLHSQPDDERYDKIYHLHAQPFD